MIERNEKSLTAEDIAPPTWFTHSLELAADYELFLSDPLPAPPAFLKRCDEAAAGALAIVKLRNQQKRKPFWPAPLAVYLRELAAAAEASLATALSFCKLSEAAPLDAGSAGALGRLCQTIGLSLRETMAYTRITVAEQLGFAPVQMLTARCRANTLRQPPLAECEAALAELEADYHQADLQTLQRIEDAISAVYAEHNSAAAAAER